METEIDLNEWFSKTFNEPRKDYLSDDFKVNLDSLQDDLKVKLSMKIVEAITEDIYDKYDPSDPDISYHFYFAFHNLPNKTLLECLYKAYGEINER